MFERRPGAGVMVVSGSSGSGPIGSWSRRALAVQVALAVLFGAGAGLGLFTFAYARGFSYMTDDPAACANCHVMQDHFDGWLKSSHRAVAVCNDCHTPPGFWAKYYTKALNGWNHSRAFTTGNYPDPIRITERNKAVAELACRKCHEPVVELMVGRSDGTEFPSCIRCHAEVGHP